MKEEREALYKKILAQFGQSNNQLLTSEKVKFDYAKMENFLGMKDEGQLPGYIGIFHLRERPRPWNHC